MVNILNLGELYGDVLLFGGPYGNLQATIAMMDWADDRNIPRQNRICTGDVVAYCGDGAATVAEMRARSGPVVTGNCEQQLASGQAECACGFEEGSTCYALAQAWYAHALKTIAKTDADWMATCPDRVTFILGGRTYVAIHGGATNISRFIWPDDPAATFTTEIGQLRDEVGDFDAVISGHSGIAFTRQIDAVTWINAGVIGMPPHDGGQQTRFTILDDKGPQTLRLSYDVDAAVRAMEMAGLTQGYHHSLKSGYWPSQDILPPELRREK